MIALALLPHNEGAFSYSDHRERMIPASLENQRGPVRFVLQRLHRADHQKMIANVYHVLDVALDPGKRIVEQGQARRAAPMRDAIELIATAGRKSPANVKLPTAQHIHAEASG